MAVMGRSESNQRLPSHTAMPASMSALPSVKNIFTSSANVCASRADTNSANCVQCPGGCSERGPSAQYSAITLPRSSRCAFRWIVSRVWRSYSRLGKRAGPAGRSASDEGSANGVTSPQCAPT